MITKEQWKKATESKQTVSKITNEEIQKYLEDGGVITRREKGGLFTYWELKDDGTLGQINENTSRSA